MRAIKIIGIILLLLVALFFLVALILPGNMHIEASVTMNKSPDVVFNQVNNFKSWSAWSPWEKADPEMKSVYEGPVSGVGAKHIWESESQGDGTQTITKSVPYELIETEIDFYERGTSTSFFKFEEKQGSTLVTWGFDTKLGYPIWRYFILFKSQMEGVFQQGLDDLKTISEESPDPIPVEVTLIPQMSVISIKDSSHWDEIGGRIGGIYESLEEVIRKRGLAITGVHYCQYHVWDEANQFSIFEAGIPVDKTIDLKKNIESKVLPESRALKSTHYGAYENIAPVYYALINYVETHNLNEIAGPIEFYITGPEQDADTNQWITEVYFPIK